MEALTFKRKMIIVVIEFIISELISFAIQLGIPTETVKNIKMKTIIDNAIIFGTLFIIIFIICQIAYWYVKYLNKSIKQQSVINKFNSIMIVRFEENYRANVCQVFDNDLALFTNEELMYLNNYLNQKDKLKIEMKGRNVTLGNPC